MALERRDLDDALKPVWVSINGLREDINGKDGIRTETTKNSGARKIVYGLVALILSGVALAGLALILKS